MEKLNKCAEVVQASYCSSSIFVTGFPAGTYLLKVNNRNTSTWCEIYSKLTIKTPRHRSGVFNVNFDHNSRHALVFLLLTLNMQLLAGFSCLPLE